MDALAGLMLTVAVAYVSTNVDGYILLASFFSDERFRTLEIVSGQFISVALQVAISFAVVQFGGVRNAPFIGLAGVVPMLAGLTRIVAWARCAQAADGVEVTLSGAASDAAARTAAVAAVATSGAVDNVMVYSSVFVGRRPDEILLSTAVFVVLTAGLCVAASLTARTCTPISALKATVGRIAPFATLGIGVSLLIRFDTLLWICSLV
jgi:cadmium resistance protein CadD (predicted permease)